VLVYWCHCFRHGPSWTIAQEVTHCLLLLLYHVNFLLTSCEAQCGQCGTGPGCTQSCFDFLQHCIIAQHLFIINLWGMIYLWHYHAQSHPLSLFNCNLAFYWSMSKEVRLDYNIYTCCSGSSYQIVLGANRYDGSESGSLITQSTSSIVHSQYNPSTINNDIAVVRLPSPVSYTSEYCHFVTSTKIILLILQQINSSYLKHGPLFTYLNC
jgi:hypothetical protein